MKFKAIAAFIAVTGMLVLAGCQGGEAGKLPAVESTAFGVKPTITVPSSNPPKVVIKTEIIKAQVDAPKVEEKDLVVIDFYAKTWQGKDLDNTTMGTTASFVPVTLGKSNFTAFDELVGLQVGSRVMLIIPPEYAYGEAGNEQLGIGPNETLIYLVDIRSRISAKDAGAELKADAVPNPKMPVGMKLSFDDKNIANLDISPGVANPNGQEFMLLATGSGKTVGLTDAIAFKSKVYDWDSKVVQNTWEDGTLDVMSKLPKSLLDMNLKVGSQVLWLRPTDGVDPSTATVIQIVDAFTLTR